MGHPGIQAVGHSHGKSSDKMPALTDTGPFVFQALGSIQESNGEMEAIIADGSQVYIVKQGDVFADRYQAVSVDPSLVLAVRTEVSGAKDRLVRHTDPATLSASNKMHGVLDFSPAGVPRVPSLDGIGVPAISGLTEIGVNLFNMSPFTGLDLQSHLVPADNSYELF
jgi:hypothetical protein